MPEIEISRVRSETPSCENILHFNNAGASLQPQPVYSAVVDHLGLERRIGAYEAEAAAAAELEDFYSAFADLLGCRSEEIAYVENATRAWDMAFYSLPLGEGDRILTHEAEYVSNYLAFLQLARRRGVEIDVVPSDSSGQIDVEAMAGMITAKTKLVAITHVPTQGGLVNPVEEVGRVARDNGLLYLLDACQAVGQIPLDVDRIGCDILSGTGRKFLRGPRGTGFLYVRRSLLKDLDPPFIDLHAAEWVARDEYRLRDDARRFENWESYVAGRVGLRAAVRYALNIGIEAIERRNTALAAELRSRLLEIPGVKVHDRGTRQCAIVTFTKEAEPAEALAQRLLRSSANVSVSHSNYARLDFDARGLDAVVRASVHYFNTSDDVQRFCALVAGNNRPKGSSRSKAVEAVPTT